VSIRELLIESTREQRATCNIELKRISYIVKAENNKQKAAQQAKRKAQVYLID
jgi:hypothetical protein